MSVIIDERARPDTSEDELRALIAHPDFPCVGAKSAMARGGLRILTCAALTSGWDDVRIHRTLMDWAATYRRDPGDFVSLALVFDGPCHLDEPAFQQALWLRIQSFADKDHWLGLPYDHRVSPDPDDPHFALSFGGAAFFVVGLHPHASRPASRAPRPTLVFNLHDQFERLRAEGRYERLRDRIVARDVALAGSANPMLSAHGETSAARQYSGRQVSDDWRCPFRDPRAS